MTAAEACAALTADRVNLVDEHDGRCVLLCLLEQVTHAGRADADIQLNEVRAGDGQERNACLACDRLGDQRFTGARRADEQHALGDTCADLHELLRIFQELNDFLKLGLFLVRACDIVERHLVLAVLRQLCTRLAELHRACTAAGLLVHHEIPERADQHHEDEIRQELRPPRDCRGDVVYLGQRAVLHLLVDDLAELRPPDRGVVADLVADRAVLVLEVHGQRAALQRVAVHVALFEILVHIRVGNRLGFLRLTDDVAYAGQQAHQYEQVKAEAFHFAFQIGLTPLSVGKKNYSPPYTCGLRMPMYGRLRYFSA